MEPDFCFVQIPDDFPPFSMWSLKFIMDLKEAVSPCKLNVPPVRMEFANEKKFLSFCLIPEDRQVDIEARATRLALIVHNTKP